MGKNIYANIDGREKAERVHLTRLSMGWEPLIKWHAGRGCNCRCDEHHYRNWDEFKSFVRRDDVTIEYSWGDSYDPEELIAEMESKNDRDENRSHVHRHYNEFVVIDGWKFAGGAWE